MAREYIQVYHSYLESFENLSDEEVGRLIRAALIYSSTGVQTSLLGNERFVFPSVRSQIDRDIDKYKERCKKNAQNANQRWNPRPNIID